VTSDAQGATGSAGRKSQATAQVLTNVPPVIVDELEQFLVSGADQWTFDAFRLDQLSSGHALSTLAFYLLQSTGLMKQHSIRGVKVARFLRAIEAGYQANAYHNAIHAADVLQTMHVVIQRSGMLPRYADPLTHLACLLAAAVHDLEHVGLTNDFLNNSDHDLAIRYNDRSPMENHHLAACFSLLQQPHLNFLSHFAKDVKDKLRKFSTVHSLMAKPTEHAAASKQHQELVLRISQDDQASRHSTRTSTPQLRKTPSLTTIDAISIAQSSLYTSSALPASRRGHASLQLQRKITSLADFYPGRPGVAKASPIAESLEEGVTAQASIGSAASGPAPQLAGQATGTAGGDGAGQGPLPGPCEPLDEAERLLSLQVALKCADIGMIAEGQEVNMRWVQCLEQEFFAQGDKEKAAGLTVSPLMDRDKPGVSKSQVAFYDFVGTPMFQNFTRVFPGMQPMMDQLQANYR
ncbi:PDEase domain-containing protein, partial [Haematococcus lacustris]